MVARGTVNWIITLCVVGVVVAKATLRHPYRSPGCANVLCGARADVTDFSYMTLMDKSAVKHNMLKGDERGQEEEGE